MKCPYCNQTFPLTWSRYLGAPSGRHTCPACAKHSRLAFGVSQSLLVLAVLLLISIPSVYFLQHTFGGYWGLFGVVPGFLVAFPLDKKIDEQYRRLKPDEKNNPVAK